MDHQKDIEHLAGECRHRKKVHRDALLGVVLQKGSPPLRWRFSSLHVLGHGGGTELDSELQQFPVNARRSPSRVVVGHLSDELPRLAL